MVHVRAKYHPSHQYTVKNILDSFEKKFKFNLFFLTLIIVHRVLIVSL